MTGFGSLGNYSLVFDAPLSLGLLCGGVPDPGVGVESLELCGVETALSLEMRFEPGSAASGRAIRPSRSWPASTRSNGLLVATGLSLSYSNLVLDRTTIERVDNGALGFDRINTQNIEDNVFSFGIYAAFGLRIEDWDLMLRFLMNLKSGEEISGSAFGGQVEAFYRPLGLGITAGGEAFLMNGNVATNPVERVALFSTGLTIRPTDLWNALMD